MEIEEVAEKTPDKIIKEPSIPLWGSRHNGRNIAFALGLQKIEPAVINPFVQMLGNLYRLFMDKNAALVEINPLIITKEKTLVALDGKVSFDDNGFFKHEDVQKCAISTKKSRWKSKPRRTISTMSSWTATSAAW